MDIRKAMTEHSITAQNHCSPKLYSTKASNDYCLAGLLTYSIFEILPIFRNSGSIFQKLWCGAYSSGSVPDFHRIPF